MQNSAPHRCQETAVWNAVKHTKNKYIASRRPSVTSLNFRTLLLSSFWTSRGRRCVPSPPRFLPSIFIAHRVQHSHCSSIFHRVLLTHALALSASQLVHKKKSQRIYTSMHSAWLELTKLTFTRLEVNLIRHRGDRHRLLSYLVVLVLVSTNTSYVHLPITHSGSAPDVCSVKTFCTSVPGTGGQRFRELGIGETLVKWHGTGILAATYNTGRPGGVSGYPRAWYRSVS